MPVNSDWLWTWIKGSSNTNTTGIYGTQGTPNNANMPGGRSLAVSWMDRNNKLYLLGGENVNGRLNDLWCFDLISQQWTWLKGSQGVGIPAVYGTKGVPASDNDPGERVLSASWIDNITGKLYLFGGNAPSFNDLWCFDLSTKQWTWLKGSNQSGQNGIYGTLNIQSDSNTPGARFAATSWTTRSNQFYLFGGNDGYDSFLPNAVLNDLWCFDPSSKNWTWIKGSNTFNQPGIYGIQGTPDSNNTPGARRGAISWIDQSDRLYLFGGYGLDTNGNSGYLNDLWRFDITTKTWTWLKGSNNNNQLSIGAKNIANSDNTPGARSSASAWTDSTSRLYLFGGDSNFGPLNDLWCFDPLTNNWTWIGGSNLSNTVGIYGTQNIQNPTNIPGSRSGSLAWIDSQDNLYLFGGFGNAQNNNNGYLNDLWTFTPLCSFLISDLIVPTVSLLPSQPFNVSWRMLTSTLPITYQSIVSLNGSDIAINNSNANISDTVPLTAPNTIGTYNIQLRTVSNTLVKCSDIKTKTIQVVCGPSISDLIVPTVSLLPSQTFNVSWVMLPSFLPIRYKSIVSLNGSDIAINNTNTNISDVVVLTAPNTIGTYTIQLRTVSNNSDNCSDSQSKNIAVGGAPIVLSDVKTSTSIAVPCQPLQLSWRIAPAVLPPNHTSTITSNFFSATNTYTSDFISVPMTAPTSSGNYPITIKVARTGIPIFSDQKTINLTVDTFLLSDVIVIPANPLPKQVCLLSWRVITNALPANYVATAITSDFSLSSTFTNQSAGFFSFTAPSQAGTYPLSLIIKSMYTSDCVLRGQTVFTVTQPPSTDSIITNLPLILLFYILGYVGLILYFLYAATRE